MTKTHIDMGKNKKTLEERYPSGILSFPVTPPALLRMEIQLREAGLKRMSELIGKAMIDSSRRPRTIDEKGI